jgi:ABC-type nitrate/sulfonate/bicarbonate transport system permease component
MTSLPTRADAAPRAASRPAWGRALQPWLRTIVGVASVATFLLVWQFVGVREVIRSDLISYPTEIVRSLAAMIASGELWSNLVVTLQEFAMGFAPAVIFGVALGLAFALSRRFLYLFDPLFAALYTAPMISFVPVLVVWFGVGMQSKAVITFLSAFIPIVINTRTGVSEVSESWIKALRAYGANRWQIVAKGLIPGALPAIMAGVRLAIGRSIVSLIAAEMYVSVKGVGRLVQVYSTSDRAAEIFVLVIVISSLGFIGVVLVRRIEAFVAPWSAAR